MYYSSFPEKIKIPSKTSNWTTRGITVSCKRMRELYTRTVCRKSNNSELSNYYKQYRNILSSVIKEATGLQYDINSKLQ
jgi:hypothetical protein